MIAVVEGLIAALTGYAVLGFVFALWFVAAGVTRLDPNARGSGIAFRVIILPGVAALWPLLLCACACRKAQRAAKRGLQMNEELPHTPRGAGSVLRDVPGKKTT
jgi:hypothetical protein